MSKFDTTSLGVSYCVDAPAVGTVFDIAECARVRILTGVSYKEPYDGELDLAFWSEYKCWREESRLFTGSLEHVREALEHVIQTSSWHMERLQRAYIEQWPQNYWPEPIYDWHESGGE